jgi:hypothetical protein
MPLGDHALVYQSNGAGSVYGHSIIGQEPTTIDYEKKIDPYLQINQERLTYTLSLSFWLDGTSVYPG